MLNLCFLFEHAVGVLTLVTSDTWKNNLKERADKKRQKLQSRNVLPYSVASVMIRTFSIVNHPELVPHKFNQEEKHSTVRVVIEQLFKHRQLN